MRVHLNKPYINVTTNEVIKLVKRCPSQHPNDKRFETEEGTVMSESTIASNYRLLVLEQTMETKNSILESLSAVDGSLAEELQAIKAENSPEQVPVQPIQYMNNVTPVMEPPKNINDKSNKVLTNFKTVEQFIDFSLKIKLPNEEFIKMYLENTDEPENFKEDFKEFYFEMNKDSIYESFKQYIEFLYFVKNPVPADLIKTLASEESEEF